MQRTTMEDDHHVTSERWPVVCGLYCWLAGCGYVHTKLSQTDYNLSIYMFKIDSSSFRGPQHSG